MSQHGLDLSPKYAISSVKEFAWRVGRASSVPAKARSVDRRTLGRVLTNTVMRRSVAESALISILRGIERSHTIAVRSLVLPLVAAGGRGPAARGAPRAGRGGGAAGV